MEVYYVDDFGGRIPASWLGQGGSPDDCWHRVEVPMSPLPDSHEGLTALNQEVDDALEAESPC